MTNKRTNFKAMIQKDFIAYLDDKNVTYSKFKTTTVLGLSVVKITPDQDANSFTILATAKTTGKTGVEMEALAAVSVAGLTLYDMLKAVDKHMRLHGVEVIEKTGGKAASSSPTTRSPTVSP